VETVPREPGGVVIEFVDEDDVGTHPLEDFGDLLRLRIGRGCEIAGELTRRIAIE
jgi:hypothetical protein